MQAFNHLTGWLDRGLWEFSNEHIRNKNGRNEMGRDTIVEFKYIL